VTTEALQPVDSAHGQITLHPGDGGVTHLINKLGSSLFRLWVRGIDKKLDQRYRPARLALSPLQPAPIDDRTRKDAEVHHKHPGPSDSLVSLLITCAIIQSFRFQAMRTTAGHAVGLAAAGSST